ncbi:MAG TPA: SIS domain-containing protein [Solirubrobacteraceae bacterium]|jgi:glucosamine--fructose-6-phosphate aminotransferase (isomerizing)|nr:SIS domain-containing protein [Solirubrobacteraceae bacterium]
MTEMAKTMERQPEDLERILADSSPVEAAATRLADRRIFVVGTGTSWHAANQGAYFLRHAGVDAVAVSAAECALWGPRPTPADALVLLSHRGTKRYTSEVLERARAEGIPTVAIGGIDTPGVDIETVVQETAGTFTASHLGALARLVQLAVTLGAELGEVEAIPAAVRVALDSPAPALAPPERGIDFVGAGPNAWTAAEGALKVREAAHLFTAGWEAEQLLHGPSWALGSGDALVSLDGGGPGAERLAELAEAVEGRGARVYRFAARELDEPLSVFPLTVTVQRIALDFAIALGTDPDNVRPPEWDAIGL